MLVYVNESKMGELLKPIEEEDIPIWIQEKEFDQNKKIEMKNYNQVLQTFILDPNYHIQSI